MTVTPMNDHELTVLIRKTFEDAFNQESEFPSEDSAGPRAAGLRAVYELGATHVIDAVQLEIDDGAFSMHYDEDPGDPPGNYLAVAAIERAFDSLPEPSTRRRDGQDQR